MNQILNLSLPPTRRPLEKRRLLLTRLHLQAQCPIHLPQTHRTVRLDLLSTQREVQHTIIDLIHFATVPILAFQKHLPLSIRILRAQRPIHLPSMIQMTLARDRQVQATPRAAQRQRQPSPLLVRLEILPPEPLMTQLPHLLPPLPRNHNLQSLASLPPPKSRSEQFCMVQIDGARHGLIA
jgi:hypothetical protein